MYTIQSAVQSSMRCRLTSGPTRRRGPRVRSMVGGRTILEVSNARVTQNDPAPAAGCLEGCDDVTSPTARPAPALGRLARRLATDERGRVASLVGVGDLVFVERADPVQEGELVA